MSEETKEALNTGIFLAILPFVLVLCLIAWAITPSDEWAVDEDDRERD